MHSINTFVFNEYTTNTLLRFLIDPGKARVFPSRFRLEG
jgi:hypothetical protein